MTPDWLEVALRLLQYAAALPLFGIPAFRLYNRQGISCAEAGRLLLAAGILVAAALSAAILLSLLLHDSIAEALTPLHFWQVVGHLQAGQVLVVRAILALLFLLLLVYLRQSRRGQPSMATLPLAAAGAFIVASFAWSGHGAAGAGAAGLLHLVADIAHLLAAAIWLGALCLLLAMVWSRSIADPARQSGVHGLLHRFSTLGLWAVSVLLLSGLVNAAFLVGIEGIDRLFTDLYGRLLLAKTGIFLAMVLLAAGNRFLWVPKLDRDIRSGSHRPSALPALRWSIGLEVALGLSALLAVAIMGRLPPIAG